MRTTNFLFVLEDTSPVDNLAAMQPSIDTIPTNQVIRLEAQQVLCVDSLCHIDAKGELIPLDWVATPGNYLAEKGVLP
eukprot:3991280-Ditylum_brightwellii.AAC.1